jgi:hypothetical protein
MVTWLLFPLKGSDCKRSQPNAEQRYVRVDGGHTRQESHDDAGNGHADCNCFQDKIDDVFGVFHLSSPIGSTMMVGEFRLV